MSGYVTLERQKVVPSGSLNSAKVPQGAVERAFPTATPEYRPRKTSSTILDDDMEMSFSGEAIEMSWFATPGWKAPSFLDEPDASRRGRVETHELESASLGKKHSVDVYLPAGYASGDEALPVAYLHGGAAAKERAQLPRALDNLVGQSVRPVIAVFISETPPLFGSPAPYAQMVVAELIPFIDSTYRTIPSAEGRASLGNGSLGFPALLCAFMQPGVIGKVATQSAFLFDFSMGALRPLIKNAEQQPLDVYMEWGSYDLRSLSEDWSMAEKNVDLVALLVENGYAPAGGEVPDGTGWSSWTNRTDAVFETLFPVE